MKILILTTLLGFAAFQAVDDDNCPVCCSTLKSRPQMTYTYYQNTGHFVGGEGDYAIDTYGYSGDSAHDARNDPTKQCEWDVGPAPATTYQLAECQDLMHGDVIRPCSFWMKPVKDGTTCGRSEIMLHGCQCCTEQDETQPPVDGCSKGCVVISHENRKKARVGDIIIVKQYEETTQ